MTEDVLNWIKKEKLMTEGDTVIVGLSGGADSVALLLVLLELRQRIGYTLLAIHVEHGIRGEESRKDTICKLETNIDDCTGEMLGYVMDRLFEEGARDVHYIPVFMKKPA